MNLSLNNANNSRSAMTKMSTTEYVLVTSTWSPEAVAIVTISLLAVLIMTVFGNVVVVLFITKTNSLKSMANNQCLVSLSLADFLVGLLVMPCAIDGVIAGRWRCGKTWSQLNAFGNFCFCISSIMHLLMLSIDRYIALIYRPLTYEVFMTNTRATCLCVTLWCYAFVWALPPLFGVSSYECFIPYIGECKPTDWSKDGASFVFALSVVSGTYGMALLVMVYVYWKIALVVRSQARRIASTAVLSSENTSPHITTTKAMKGVMTLLIVIGTYLVCWSPYCVNLFIEIARGKKTSGSVSIIAMFIGFANSACNPVIYTIRYRRFRMSVARMLLRGRHLRDNGAHTVNGTRVNIEMTPYHFSG